MSEVSLATRYSPENYPYALENLVKRYEKNGQPVHYTDAGFGEVSEDQANAALRFFAEIELIENPKGANYAPPESVITWIRKMGPTKEEAKQEVREMLMQYDVFNETIFVLQEGGQELDSLATQVGGLVGIDEDELSDMERTIRVFAELGFLEAGTDGQIHLPDEMSAKDEPQASLPEAEDGPSSETGSEAEEDSDQSVDSRSRPFQPTGELTVDVSISMDATEMDVDDLQKKLEVIEKSQNHDGE